MKQARFAMLARAKPDRSERLLALAQEDITDRWHLYEQMAGLSWEADSDGNGAEEVPSEKEAK